VALDGSGRNSPFAGALVKHLATSKEDLSTILIDVRNDVMKDTQSKQVPWEHSALTGRFYFTPTARPVPLVAAEPAPGRPAEAAEAWDRTKDSTNITVLEAFIARYKETYYAELARARLEVAKKQQSEQSAAPSSGVLLPSSGWLGVKVQNIDVDTASRMGSTKGALVVEVAIPGPAADAGLKSGDAILSINGTPVADSRDFVQQIATKAPNTAVNLRVMRDQVERIVVAKLGTTTPSIDQARFVSASKPQPLVASSQFNGNWTLTQLGRHCSDYAKVTFSIKIADGLVTGSNSGGAINGTISPSGQIAFSHPGLIANRADYSGLLQRTSGSGVFNMLGTSCSGTFTAVRK
jgi:membrane-associated protease RseP (regulator of RpoE activity)